jgi:hypothetical protein
MGQRNDNEALNAFLLAEREGIQRSRTFDEVMYPGEPRHALRDPRTSQTYSLPATDYGDQMFEQMSLLNRNTLEQERLRNAIKYFSNEVEVEFPGVDNRVHRNFVRNEHQQLSDFIRMKEIHDLHGIVHEERRKGDYMNEMKVRLTCRPESLRMSHEEGEQCLVVVPYDIDGYCLDLWFSRTGERISQWADAGRGELLEKWIEKLRDPQESDFNFPYQQIHEALRYAGEKSLPIRRLKTYAVASFLQVPLVR